MAVYHAIVDGDPITSGGRVHVFDYDETIEGSDGMSRAVAYRGNKAYCKACETWGVIVPHAGIADYLRTDHCKYGKQAVSGDGVICKCERMPLVIAVYGRSESMHDASDSTWSTNNTQTQSLDIFDESFTLTDIKGHPVSGVRYRACLGSSVVASGVTDTNGQTARIVTHDARWLTLQIMGEH